MGRGVRVVSSRPLLLIWLGPVECSNSGVGPDSWVWTRPSRCRIRSWRAAIYLDARVSRAVAHPGAEGSILLVVACRAGVVFGLVDASLQRESPPFTCRADGLGPVAARLARPAWLTGKRNLVPPDSRWWRHDRGRPKLALSARRSDGSY